MHRFCKMLLFLKKHRKDNIPQDDTIAIGRYPLSVASYSWVPIPKANDPLPPGIVCGGRIETGEISFVGRGKLGDAETSSGFFTKEGRQLYIPYDSNEHKLSNFDMLVVDNQESLSWERCEVGHLPTGISLIPLPARENPLYFYGMFIGRICTPLTDEKTNDNITLTLTRFPRTGEDDHHCLHVWYSGLEYCFPHKEMLMMKPSPGKLKHICRYVILNCLNPVPLKKSVKKLPLPGKMKEFLEEMPDLPQRIDHFPQHSLS